MMKIIFLFSLLVAVTVADSWEDSNNAYASNHYLQVVTFINDQISSTPSLQYASYAGPKADLGLSDSQIESDRQSALAWMKSRFGIPTDTGVYNATTTITYIPGWGTVLPIYCGSGYNLQASQSILLTGVTGRLFEFVFFPSEAVGVQNWGGSYATYMARRGRSIAVTGDSISAGKYYLSQGSLKFGVVQFGNQYPVQANEQGFTYEEMTVVSSPWGTGYATVSARLGITSSGQYLTNFINTQVYAPVANPELIYADLS
jgi:hypothetical protein